MTGQRRKWRLHSIQGQMDRPSMMVQRLKNGKLGAYFGVDRNPEELDGGSISPTGN